MALWCDYRFYPLFRLTCQRFLTNSKVDQRGAGANDIFYKTTDLFVSSKYSRL